MPSQSPLPTVPELVRAFHNGVRAMRDKREDRHAGSIYDHMAGVSAILWSRQAQRDRDMFRSCYVDFASGHELTDRVSFEFRVDRLLDTKGIGYAVLSRPNASAGADMVWTGTQIRVLAYGGTAVSLAYEVTANTPVGATALEIKVPIRATVAGVGVAANVTLQDVPLPVLDDPLKDPSWSVIQLTCADGTVYQKDSEYRAGARDAERKSRIGYKDSIIQACLDEGATYVAAFSSDYAGSQYDWGLNAVYVGDASFEGNATLIKRVTLKLEEVRVLGADVQVLPMSAGRLKINANVRLGVDPSAFDWIGTADDIKRAIAGSFQGASNGFTYRKDAIAGVAYQVSPRVIGMDFITPTTDHQILSTGPVPSFPPSLVHFSVLPSDIILTPIPPG